eukprot:6331593-Prymnesium_polylepis.1
MLQESTILGTCQNVPISGFSRLPVHRWRLSPPGGGRSAGAPSPVSRCHTLAALYKSPLGAPTHRAGYTYTALQAP